MQKKLRDNLKEIIIFANVFGKTTGVPVVRVHNNSNTNIHIEMRNENTQNNFLYVICDNERMIGYNATVNKYKCASKFPEEFHQEIEKAVLNFTQNVVLSFHQDIKRFRLQRVKDYTPDEVQVAKKYYNSKEKYKSINEFNKWKAESIPLIEYKHPDFDIEEIIECEVCEVL